jgi:hypothetical protein
VEESCMDLDDVKILGTLLGVLLIGATGSITDVGITTYSQSHDETPTILVYTQYNNLTTISIRFAPLIFSMSSARSPFSETTKWVDHVDVYIDNIHIKSISGNDLETSPYTYSVNTERHAVRVEIQYKNGENLVKEFSNADIENGVCI